MERHHFKVIRASRGNLDVRCVDADCNGPDMDNERRG